MILRLVVPQINRMIPGGSVLKWHVAEGQRVGFGDDLLDLTAQLAGRTIRPLADRIRTMTEARRIHVQDVVDLEQGAPAATVSFRITASDVGILRRICAPEGTYGDVGALLAVLTTGEDEPCELPETLVATASLFRVVPNVI